MNSLTPRHLQLKGLVLRRVCALSFLNCTQKCKKNENQYSYKTIILLLHSQFTFGKLKIIFFLIKYFPSREWQNVDLRKKIIKVKAL